MTAKPVAAALLVLLAACGGDAGPLDPGGTTPPPNTPVTNHAGFDIGVYPGDAAVRAWSRPGSPYEWMGYYLPAPCHRDTTFAGRRSTIAAAGFGFTVIYVGQQTFDGIPIIDGEAIIDGQSESLVTCSRTLLSSAQGDVEGLDAVERAVAEGFPAGTVIYLDLEPMQNVTAAMKDYYGAWVTRVVVDGRYRPGIYAHVRNAAEVHTDVVAAASRAGARVEPPFWIASTNGFALTRPPTDVGFAFAAAWQGALDVSRTWNGVSLRIDESVAARSSPSGP